MAWRRASCVVLAGMIGLLLFALVGCSGGTKSTSSEPEPETVEPTTPEAAAVQSFFDAKTKHGTLTFTNVWDDGTVDEQKIEYWFDEGGRYRLTWFNEDGSERLHMISPDGQKLYHCRPDEKVCELAYTAAEFHQWIFNGPPDWTPGEGVEEEGLTKFTYSAKKLWDIEGASQTFYLEDLVIYADDTRIARTIARTDGRVPEAEEDLVSSTYAFDEPELGVEIPEEMFTLPYDITEAE